MGGGASKPKASRSKVAPDLSDLGERSKLVSIQKTPVTLEEKVAQLTEQVADLTARLSRHGLRFSVAQYNILAGYLGNNTEPWFLYGVDMPPERRKQIVKKHGEKGADGKYVNVGWPNYVRGILSDDEIAKVEAIDAAHFAWEPRKLKLMATIKELNSDVLSLVECDHYDDYFKAELEKMGYDTIWSKRPRPGSHDGCCIAWKRSLFQLESPMAVEEYVDRYDPVKKRTYKDRIALLALLRFKGTSQKVLVVSTHLTRNPEDPAMDALRAKQIGQVLRRISEFTAELGCLDSTPVVLAGDLNATSFQKLRGIANAVTLLAGDATAHSLHPFTFDCKELPTGKTSVTAARDVRIDALLYQSQWLQLVDSLKAPPLISPIPDATHPSDHVPIMATFEVRSSLDYHRECARLWFNTVGGRFGNVPLTAEQLRAAFFLFEVDSDDAISRAEFVQCAGAHLGYDNLPEKELNSVFDKAKGAAKAPEGASAGRPSTWGDGFISYVSFCEAYTTALATGGLPGLDDLRDAFDTFDEDHSGNLDAKEVAGMFKNCSPVALPEGADEKILQRIDKDGSGNVSISEFLDELTAAWISRAVHK